MYLARKIFVGAQYKHRAVNAQVNVSVGGTLLEINCGKISYIDENIGCWRKANAIHGWFVENIQNGINNCECYMVDLEKLKELKVLCLSILNEKFPEKQKELARELLPPSEGFFFGNYDIDEFYMEDLQDTVEIIQECKKYPDDEFEYSSSW